MVVKEWSSLLISVFLAGILTAASAVLLARVVEYTRLYHPLVCRSFKRRYRVAHSLNNRFAVKKLADDRLLNAASVAVHGRTASARWSRVRPRTPGPAAHVERGDIHGFPPSPDPLL